MKCLCHGQKVPASRSNIAADKHPDYDFVQQSYFLKLVQKPFPFYRNTYLKRNLID